MEKEKNKFNALTPEVLNENKQIYTEALDYAFGNSDIKNIAITGIYGAEKSTVWNAEVLIAGYFLTMGKEEYGAVHR